MADEFIEIEIDYDPTTLQDRAMERLEDEWEDYTAEPGDLETVFIEAVTPIAAETVAGFRKVGRAIFRTFGTELADVPYASPEPAVASLTITVIPEGESGRGIGQAVLIEEGSQFSIDGWAFATTEDVTVPAGNTVAPGVEAVSLVETADANELQGDFVEPITALREVVSASLDAPTANGTDEETDTAYDSRLSRVLELQAQTLVTTRDFELWALITYPTIVARAVARHLGARQIEITLIGWDGLPIPDATKDSLEAQYDQYRLVNTTLSLVDANYSVIGVDYSVHPYPNVDNADLLARIDAALAEALSPALWGQPRYTSEAPYPVWFNDPIVRYNKMIDIIGDVEGTDYVEDLTLSGSTGAADANGNWVMPGNVALPQPGVMSGAIV